MAEAKTTEHATGNLRENIAQVSLSQEYMPVVYFFLKQEENGEMSLGMLANDSLSEEVIQQLQAIIVNNLKQ